MFFDRFAHKMSSSKKVNFKFYMLETTQYNYKDMAKLYKEQTQLGYSKMLPQIALGHSQSFILNTAYFENDILKMKELGFNMLRKVTSNTMSGYDILGSSNKTNKENSQNNVEDKKSVNTEKSKGGRPEKADSEKTEKTI